MLRKRAEPAGVPDGAVGAAQQEDLADESVRRLERREREVELVDLAADRRDQQEERKARRKVRPAPDIHRKGCGVLIEVAHQRLRRRRIEAQAAQRLEARYQAAVAHRPI